MKACIVGACRKLGHYMLQHALDLRGHRVETVFGGPCNGVAAICSPGIAGFAGAAGLVITGIRDLGPLPPDPIGPGRAEVLGRRVAGSRKALVHPMGRGGRHANRVR
jgi:hypothetical protein